MSQLSKNTFAELDAIRNRIAARCPHLHRMLLARFPSEIVLDAVQNAMLRALEWVDSGKFVGVRDENAWLATVAVRAALTILGRQRAISLEASHELEVDPVEELDRVEAIRTNRAKLDAAIERLPDELRETFIFCCVEGNSIAEAAKAFGCTEGVIRSRLARARKALRLLLGVKLPKSENDDSR